MITNPKIERYCIDHSTPPTVAQKALIERTHRELPQASQMQVGALEGAFLTSMTRLMRAKRILEFGTFTGYSALAFAEGVGADGKVTTLDLDPGATEMAKAAWKEAGLADRIELLLAPALDSLAQLAEEIRKGTRPKFDLVFIDADKVNYKNYYEGVLPILDPKGAILVDNVLWAGEILDPQDNAGRAMAAFNEHVFQDSRVEKVMLPIRDGVYLIRPRG